MTQLSRRTKIFIAFVVMVVGGGVLAYLAAVSQNVSPIFIEARMQGALIAQGIVDLSLKSSNSIEEINKLDRQGKYEQALQLTNQLIDQNKEIKEKALSLSKELENMTRSLDSIRSEEARSMAMQGITSRLAMISRLIDYSDSLGQLLETLKLRFSGISYGQGIVISKLIEKINNEVTAINNFDKDARRAMERFDELINNVSQER